jgi:hypothetical protein
MKWIALALSIALLGGCSFAFSRPPQRAAFTNAPPVCASHYVTSVIDGTQAVGGFLMTMAVLSEGANHESEQDTMGLLGGIMIATAGVYAASALYGLQHARACKRMERESEPQWIVAPAPPPPPSDWPPEVEQTVDADDNQIDIHTTIRRVPQPQ